MYSKKKQVSDIVAVSLTQHAFSSDCILGTTHLTLTFSALHSD